MGQAKVLLIGFDGLAMNYMRKFSEVMPNLSKLRDEGTTAPLESTFPPMTASAWPSLYTGMDPSHHGVFHFLDFDSEYPEDRETVDRTDVDAPAIWNYLTAVDIPSIVLNVPMTAPADELNGVLMPGLMAPEDAIGYPSDVRETLSEAAGQPYQIYPDEDTAAAYIDAIEMRERVSTYLLNNHEWQFGFLQLQHTDSAFHYLNDMTEIEAVMQAADSFLGTVIEQVDEDTHVLLCSDHGMGYTEGHTIYLNELLERNGYVQYDGQEQTNTNVTVRERLSGLLGTAITRGHSVVEGTPFEELILSILPTSNVKDLAQSQIDWASSTAYCRSGTELGVRLNLQGREPNGIVSPDEYEHVRDSLIELLSGLETPDGKRAFEYVKKREDVYEDGPYITDGADILVMPFTQGNNISHEVYGPLFNPNISYEHRSEGVFVGHGPAFEEWDGMQLSLPDIAPIVFSLLNLPIPKRMTGSIHDDFPARTDRDEYRDIEYRTTDAAEEGAPIGRLEDLGYL